MKNLLFTRRSLGVGGFLIALVLWGLFPQNLLAQKMNIWKGGQAGQATEWNCPRNWSLGFVPDWTCAVVIGPNAAAEKTYPVIEHPVESVQYLLLLPGARLEIAKGAQLEFELPDACWFGGAEIQRYRHQVANETVASRK